MRVIVRKERPHPGAQLRFTDIDGHRFTALATDAKKGQLADLELRHRRRARCEDRIRTAKDTGLRNLPLKGYAQNQIWCEIVALACELLAWTQMIALAGEARRWEPKRLRLRRVRLADDYGHAPIAAFAHFDAQRNRAQEWYLISGCEFLAAALTENVVAVAGVRRDEVAHIFDDAEYRNRDCFKHA